MSVLTKSEIEKLIHIDGLVSGFGNLTDQLQPNGFDLRLDNVYEYIGNGYIGIKDKRIPKYRIINEDSSTKAWFNNNVYFLPYGSYAFDIAETIKLPLDVCSFTIQRSSIMRCGCITNVGWWDSGYNGKGFSQIVVNNPNGFTIEKHAKIIQMIFLRNVNITDGYKGTYQHEGVSNG